MKGEPSAYVTLQANGLTDGKTSPFGDLKQVIHLIEDYMSNENFSNNTQRQLSPKDFRIGNYVYRVEDLNGKKSIGWIDTIYEEFAESEGWCQLEGIPIDENILLNFGFVQNKSYKKYFHFEIKDCNIRYRIGSGDLRIIRSGIDFSIPMEPIFIHELQNFFYSAFGIEFKMTDATLNVTPS